MVRVPVAPMGARNGVVLALLGALFVSQMITTNAQTTHKERSVQENYVKLNQLLKEKVKTNDPEENFVFAHDLLFKQGNPVGPALELFVKLGDLKEFYSCNATDTEWLTKNQNALQLISDKKERVQEIFTYLSRIHASKCQEDYEAQFEMRRARWSDEQQQLVSAVMDPFIVQKQQQQQQQQRQKVEEAKRERSAKEKKAPSRSGSETGSSSSLPPAAPPSSPSLSPQSSSSSSSSSSAAAGSDQRPQKRPTISRPKASKKTKISNEDDDFSDLSSFFEAEEHEKQHPEPSRGARVIKKRSVDELEQEEELAKSTELVRKTRDVAPKQQKPPAKADQPPQVSKQLSAPKVTASKSEQLHDQTLKTKASEEHKARRASATLLKRFVGAGILYAYHKQKSPEQQQQQQQQQAGKSAPPKKRANLIERIGINLPFIGSSSSHKHQKHAEPDTSSQSQQPQPQAQPQQQEEHRPAAVAHKPAQAQPQVQPQAQPQAQAPTVEAEEPKINWWAMMFAPKTDKDPKEEPPKKADPPAKSHPATIVKQAQVQGPTEASIVAQRKPQVAPKQEQPPSVVVAPPAEAASGAPVNAPGQEQARPGKKPSTDPAATWHLHIGITKRMIISGNYQIDKVKGSKLLWQTLRDLAIEQGDEFVIKNERDQVREKAHIEKLVRHNVLEPCQKFQAHFKPLFPVAKFDLRYSARPSSTNEDFYRLFAEYQLCESFLQQESELMEKIITLGLEDIRFLTSKAEPAATIASSPKSKPKTRPTKKQ